MKTFFKAFEKSTDDFNDLKDKKKVDEALQKIKEPINEFCIKLDNIKIILTKAEDIKKDQIENINDVVNQNKKIMVEMKENSNKIGNKIKEIRKKYGEKDEVLKEMNYIETKTLVLTEVFQFIEREKKQIEEETEKKLKTLEKDVNDTLSQSRLNILFIMDITNSMDIYLEEAKNGILDMIKEVKNQCAGIEIFLGFIGYKDFIDLDFGDNYINLEFTLNYESIVQNISYLKAQGGGDIPEDLCGALEMAKNKDWNGKSRFAILVTDSPCHGKKYHDLKEDDYPQGDRENRNIEDFIKYFAQEQISLYCLSINSTTDKMFGIFPKDELYILNNKI